MSRKRKVYSAAFKSKLVLEVLKNEKPLSEIAIAPLSFVTPISNFKGDISILIKADFFILRLQALAGGC